MQTAELMHSRTADGISVDLYWNPDDLEEEFRVEVIDERTGADFTLYPQTGEEAMYCFRHPFVAASSFLKAGKVAA